MSHEVLYAETPTDLLDVEQLQSKLLIIKPTKHTPDYDTKLGKTACVEADVWEVSPDGTAEHAGKVMFFQVVLVKFLASAVGQLVAARIEKPGKAYVFDALSDDEKAAVNKAAAHIESGEDSF